MVLRSFGKNTLTTNKMYSRQALAKKKLFLFWPRLHFRKIRPFGDEVKAKKKKKKKKIYIYIFLK